MSAGQGRLSLNHQCVCARVHVIKDLPVVPCASSVHTRGGGCTFAACAHATKGLVLLQAPVLFAHDIVTEARNSKSAIPTIRTRAHTNTKHGSTYRAQRTSGASCHPSNLEAGSSHSNSSMRPLCIRSRGITRLESAVADTALPTETTNGDMPSK